MTRNRTTASLVAAAALVAGCLGSRTGDGSRSDAAPPRTVHAPVAVVPPLVDDEGRPLPPVPAAMPAEAWAMTARAHAATRVQADRFARALGGSMVHVVVGPEPAGVDAVADALRGASLARASRRAEGPMPAIVEGFSAWQAARTADRLADAGFDPVFVVTPD